MTRNREISEIIKKLKLIDIYNILENYIKKNGSKVVKEEIEQSLINYENMISIMEEQFYENNSLEIPEISEMDLELLLLDLHDGISSKNKYKIINSLNEVISYLKELGLWSEENLPELNSIKKKSMFIDYKLKELVRESNKQLLKGEQNYKNLNDILSDSNGILNEISKIEGQSGAKHERINEINENINKIFDDIKLEKEAIIKTHDFYLEQNNLMVEQLNIFRVRNEEFKGLYEEKEFFEQHRAFNFRKEELKKSLNIWTFISCAGIIGFAYMMYLFIPTIDYSSSKTLVENILPLAYSSIRLIPLGLLLGFILKQYSNERKHLEIYAFKAAQVLVLDSHAKKLNDNKDEFLKTTLDKIHDEPFRNKNNKKVLTKTDFKQALSMIDNGMKILGKKGLSAKIQFDDKEEK